MHSLFRITGQPWQLLQLIWTYLENPKIYPLHSSKEHWPYWRNLTFGKPKKALNDNFESRGRPTVKFLFSGPRASRPRWPARSVPYCIGTKQSSRLSGELSSVSMSQIRDVKATKESVDTRLVSKRQSLSYWKKGITSLIQDAESLQGQWAGIILTNKLSDRTIPHLMWKNLPHLFSQLHLK